MRRVIGVFVAIALLASLLSSSTCWPLEQFRDDGTIRPAHERTTLVNDLDNTAPAFVMTLPRVHDGKRCLPQRMIRTYIKGDYVSLSALSQYPDRKLWLENGYAIVAVSGKYGFCDANGKLCIRPQFDEAGNFSDGRALIRMQGKYGYIDSKGQMIIKPQFDYAYSFIKRLGAVQIGEKWGIVNPQGDWIKEPTYERLDPLVGGILAVTFDGRQGFIDERGEIKNPQPETK